MGEIARGRRHERFAAEFAEDCCQDLGAKKGDFLSVKSVALAREGGNYDQARVYVTFLAPGLGRSPWAPRSTSTPRSRGRAW
jgi:hypothetical protein